VSAAQIKHLSDIANKHERRIIGLMSGTSLDGLDIALCTIRGHGLSTELYLDQFTTTAYTSIFQDEVRSVFAAREPVSLEDITLLNANIARTHAAMIKDALESWGEASANIDCIASHGQTIYHAPKHFHQRLDHPHATLQLGDGDHLAHLTGVLTLSDFRQKHIAAGGEGAPLAAYGDVLLLADPSDDRALINIGGIANFTYLPSLSKDTAAFSSDIGPGNTLMDAYVQAHFPGQNYDKGGMIAERGQVSDNLLAALREDPFFKSAFPKTTGPEQFSILWLENQIAAQGDNLSHEDVLATLNTFTASTIADAIASLPGQPQVFLSGGGAHNAHLRRSLERLLPKSNVQDTTALGINPDAKEAILFAVLANETLAGDPSTLSGRLTNASLVSMGKISLPT